MKKSEEAKASIAVALLSLDVGSTLPRTRDLARQAGVGNGTIQVALDSLESEGVIATSAHGSLGRRLVSSDASALWKSSRRGPLTGVLPLPESREFAGIATALSEQSTAAGFALQLLFRQGSLTRVEQLTSRVVDFSVMSRRAALHSTEQLDYLSLGPYTFYSRNAVAVIARTGVTLGEHLSVAIDRRSSDHTALTRGEFPDASFVDVPYMFIPEAVAEGRVDAAVWHRTTSSPLVTAAGLSLHELSRGGDDNDSLSEAVIAWRTNDVGVGRLITTTLSPEQIRNVQGEVMRGVRVPQF